MFIILAVFPYFYSVFIINSRFVEVFLSVMFAFLVDVCFCFSRLFCVFLGFF